MVSRYPDWRTDGADWPNREASRFVNAAGYDWHVQQMGEGPICVLLHGTAAATHSWRDVIPLLAKDYCVVAIDLPGHGFTKSNTTGKVTLPAMASAINELLVELQLSPDLIVGHSAGVAIGAQLLLDQDKSRPSKNVPLVGFTPALMPFPGLAARLFPQLAKMLFTNPFVAIIFSRMARAQGETTKFLERATGSKVDANGAKFYTRLFSTSGHCDGAIRMMANWRLEPLRDRLGELTAPVLLVHAANDTAIKRSAVMSAAALIHSCAVQEIKGLGHLAHEEDPTQAVKLVIDFMRTNEER